MFGAHLSLRVYFVYRIEFVQKFEFWFSLSDKSDSEGFIIALIFFSILIHVKKLVRRGVVGVAHRTKVAQHIILKKKCLAWTRRRIPKDLVSFVFCYLLFFYLTDLFQISVTFLT